MPAASISVQRFSLTSPKSFESILQSLDAAVGHPDMRVFMRGVATAKDGTAVEALVRQSVGPSGLMEFMRFNMHDFLRKLGTASPRIVRLLIGNPLIMKQMVVHVPDAASYAPVTVLIEERNDGVRLSYDRMASFLAPYGSAEALQVAQNLDAKIEALLAVAAG
ncbi:MAG TPA: DUF302 domain-containing protein [Terriglobales bacterium]|nr:DUF302 domain-containing protein [Terriglobales bacterium]